MTAPPAFDEGRRAELDRLVDRHLSAEDAGDVEAILEGMTDDVEHDVVGAPDSPLCGKAALRAHYCERLATTVYERAVPLRRLYGDGFVVDERIWEGRVTGQVGRLTGNGRRISQQVLQILEVRDGRIARQTLYSDHAALMRQLA